MWCLSNKQVQEGVLKSKSNSDPAKALSLSKIGAKDWTLCDLLTNSFKALTECLKKLSRDS